MNMSMQQTESCSESRMRSRTSRGVPEWSGGKELYMGSRVSAIEKVSGVTGIVPGPPEGSRGSTGWGHLSRRAPWAEVGGEPAPGGLVRPPGPPSAPRVGNPRGGGASTCLGGHSTPLAAAPLGRSHLQGRRPPWGPYIKRGVGGQPHPDTWRLPPPCYTSPSRSRLAKPCWIPAASTITPSCCCWSLLPQPLLPPCWIKKEGASSAPYVC